MQRVLEKSKVYDMLKDFDVEKQVKVISNYLRAWEDVFDIKFNNRRKPKTLEKILGLQYVLCIYPCIYNISSLQLLSRLLIAPSQCLQNLEQCA